MCPRSRKWKHRLRCELLSPLRIQTLSHQREGKKEARLTLFLVSTMAGSQSMLRTATGKKLLRLTRTLTQSKKTDWSLLGWKSQSTILLTSKDTKSSPSTLTNRRDPLRLSRKMILLAYLPCASQSRIKTTLQEVVPSRLIESMRRTLFQMSAIACASELCRADKSPWRPRQQVSQLTTTEGHLPSSQAVCQIPSPSTSTSHRS